MTLYEMIKQVSDIITPGTDAFYHYVLYSSDDDGGFLRTRYCWWDEPIRDFELGEGDETILVTSKSPIDIMDLEYTQETLVKLQFTYGIKNAKLEDADWDSE